MEGQDLLHITFTGYILQSSFYSQNLQKGGAIISQNLYFSKINISHNCKEKNLEISNVEPDIKSSALNILSLCIVPAGDLDL